MDKMADREQLKEAKGVDSVTDYVEEKENVDISRVQQGLSSLVASTSIDSSSTSLRIAQEDVNLIVDEIEVTKEIAERMLRIHGGDAKAALFSFISGN